MELFLIDGEKRRFKATVVHQPYFFLIPEDKTVGVGAAMTTTAMMMVGGCGSGSGGTSSSADADANASAKGRADELRAQDAHDLQYHYQDLLAALTRLYQPLGLRGAEILRKMDLDAPNHLGARSQALGGRPMVKLVFDNVDQLQRVKREVSDVLRANERRRADGGGDDGGGGGFDLLQTSPSVSMYDADHDGGGGGDVAPTAVERDPLSSLLDIREHDVPYLVRACIDLNLRAGCWYTLTPLPSGGVVATDRATLPKANPVVLAFDIECTKAPLKFPDADHDTIFMISYMVDGMGYLLLSRHVVGGDVSNFEYTPKPKYPGPFVVMNEPTEEALIRRFLHEFDRSCPQIVVTYNGDFFDWPFLEKRAAVYGLDLRREIGFYNAAASTEGGGGGGGGGGEFRGRRLRRRLRGPRPHRRPPRRLLLGEARLLPPPGLPGPQGRDQVQARVRPRGGRSGGHGPVRARAAGAHGELLGLRRGGDILPVRQIRAHVHLLAVHDHTHGSRGRPQEGQW